MSVKAIAWALDLELPDTTAKFALVGICNHVNERGEAFPSVETLGRYMGCHKRTAELAVMRLETLGVLTVVRSIGRRNAYRINFDWQHEDAEKQRCSTASDKSPPAAQHRKSSGAPPQTSGAPSKSSGAAPPEPSITVREPSREPSVVSPEAEALAIWNEAADRRGWPQAQAMNDQRRKALKARMAECGGIEGWKTALEKAEASSFLRGEAGRGNGHESWRCNLDFMLMPARFTKLMEGGYDDAPANQKRRSTGASAILAAFAESVAEHDPPS